MNKLMQGIERFWKEEEGAEVAEWALVAGLLVATFATAYATLGPAIEGKLGEIVSSINAPDPAL